MATATGVIDAAEATRNPYAISYALMAYGTAFPRRRSRACAGGDAPGRGDRSRQRQPLQRNPPGGYLGRTRRKFGEPLAALEYFALAIRRYHDAGNTASGRPTLAALAILLQRLARDEPAATIAGFASTPMTAVAVPEFGTAIAHLRAVLGDQTYDSLARKGETMAGVERRAALVVVARPQPAERAAPPMHLIAAADDDALGRAADAHQQVNARVLGAWQP